MMSQQTRLSDEFRQIRPRPRDEKIKSEDIVPESPPPITRLDQREEDLKLLRAFDLDQKFGPCLGITRLVRWNRSAKFNLNPPLDVKELLLTHQDDAEYMNCLWANERGLVPQESS